MNLRKTAMAVATGMLVSLSAVASTGQYWHGNDEGVKFFPTGKNLTFAESSDTVNPILTQHSQKMDQGFFQVQENFYLGYGYGLTSPAFIVGDTGVVIIDPPEDVEKMAAAKKEFRKYSDKPIAGVIYTHWHPDHYSGVRGAISDEDVANGVKVIAQEKFMSNLIASSSGGNGPIIGARVDYSLGTLLEVGPEGRVNGGLGTDFEIKSPSLIVPNTIVKKKLNITVGGVEMEIRHVPSEASDEIAVWFPQYKVLHGAEVIQGESFPNLHSIRGTRYRDPNTWFPGIDILLEYPAEYMITSHGRPVSGAENVKDVLVSYRDAIQFTYDQSIRFMNKGMTPDELVEAVTLPENLKNHPWLGDFYGSIRHAVRQIYVGELGWFEGDPTFLAPTDKNVSSERYVDMMGGRETVMTAAQTAFDAEDFQWAAELTTHVIRLDHEDKAARNLKADSLRQLGYAETNNNWRNWYITSARELDGTIDFSKRIDLQSPDLVKVFPAGNILGGLRFNLKGAEAAAAGFHMTMGIEITGEGSFGLEVRNGVAQYTKTKPAHADFTLTMNKQTMLMLFGGKTTMEKAIADGSLKLDGKASDVETYFSYFEKPSKDPIALTIR